MKFKILAFICFSFGIGAVTPIWAATILWTNGAGGNWNSPLNWLPNQVPGETDTAVITNLSAGGGPLTVLLDVNSTVAGLVLGSMGLECSGGQRLVLNGQTLVLNGPLTVNACGQVVVDSGTLAGGNANAVITGEVNWMGGRLAGTLTVGDAGKLVISSGTHDFPSCILTNNGTVLWTGGKIRGGSSGPNNQIYNYGLWEAQCDQVMDNTFGPNGVLFANFGIFRKTVGGTDSTLFQTGVSFVSLGQVDVQTGKLTLKGGGSLIGGSAATDAGTLQLAGGRFTVNGAVTSTNLQQTGGSLTGVNVFNGGFIWLGGTWDGSEVTVATNTLLQIAGSANHDLPRCILTNYGTVAWNAGTLRGGSSGPNTQLYNYGLWDCQADASFNNDYGANGVSFNNFGIFRKSAGSTTNNTVFEPGASFFSSGEVDVQTGTLSLEGSGTFAGGTATGAGTIELAAGHFTVNGTVASTNLQQTGGSLAGVNVFNGGFTWLGGTWDSSEVTVGTNALLQIAGSGNHDLPRCILTNYGTVAWNAGTLRGGSSGPNTQLYNYSLWDCRSDSSFNNAYGANGVSFYNLGVFRKSVGSTNDDTAIQAGITFNNYGLIDIQTGKLSLAPGFVLGGTGRLNFGINNLADFGRLVLSGSAALNGILSANLNNSFQPREGAAFQVVSYGSPNGLFSDFGLPSCNAWQTNYGATVFSLSVLNAQPSFTEIPTQTVDELKSFTLPLSNWVNHVDSGSQAVTFDLLSTPKGMVINTNTGIVTWTPTQTQALSTNTFWATVSDNGSPAMSGTASLVVVVRELNMAPVLPTILTQTVDELTPLTVTNTALEPDIHATTAGYLLQVAPTGMVISAGGVINWTPLQTQSPSTNLVTTIVANEDPFDTVNPNLTATNTFTVIVREVNVAPILSNISAQVAYELMPLLVTNTAFEPNIHSITGYRLLSPPDGMTVGTNGVISWVPSSTQSPGTNTVILLATNSNPFDLLNPHLAATNRFIVIVKPRPTLTDASWLPTGECQFTFETVAGQYYTLQSSTNLSEWNSILGFEGNGIPVSLTDPNSQDSAQKFYRLKLGH